MTENLAENFKVFNPKNENCPVCDGLNTVYRSNAFQQEVEIPEEVGKGYYRRINVRPSMEIIVSDVTFHDNITMGGGQDNPLHCLAFCLGDRLWWRVEENKKEYEIECGESYIFNGNQGNSICTYDPEQRFLGVSIWLDCETIKNLIYQREKEYFLTGLSYGSSIFYKRKFSPAIRLILNEIINCRYQDNIKKLYLEGKTLELIALYMDESIFENGGLHSPVRLSAADMESLHKARRILDENITSPPTIGKLARLVCLNEYKLKTGFKELFGMPVHAYVIDKRLERARLLLESKKLKVAEAAQLVGYSESGRFAEKFKQKYGVNPSEYTKNL